MGSPKRFNTAGPCNPVYHYMLPAAERLPEARGLIDALGYFVVHAPRQTGKTTTLKALARQLTAEGRYAAVHVSCETGEPAGDDYAAAEGAVLAALRRAAERDLPEPLRPPPWPQGTALDRVVAALAAWARACPRPLVIFFDEIDALRGESLRSVLRQLRAGFPDRPGGFPQSVVLCGLRDVRDYKAASGGDPGRLGTASPFNVKVKSMRLGDFAEEEVHALYRQHTEATGQRFTQAALARAFALTRGQPWLVNALAREVTEEIAIPLDQPIEEAHVDEAKERLILARQTHLDSLVARLTEPRVRRVLAPIVEGELPPSDLAYVDDLEYVRDLGLVAIDRPLRLANPIYFERILRELAAFADDAITVGPRTFGPRTFVREDGRLDMPRLIDEFVAFWRQHGEVLEQGGAYHEVAPQLVLLAFLQRVVNGGGYVEREVGIGRGRIDVLVRWPYAGPDGARAWQREALELKAWRPKKKDSLQDGLAQLDRYLDGLGLDRGILVIFDRRPDAPPPEDRTAISETRSPSGRPITLLRA